MFFFVFFIDPDNSHDSRGRETTIFYSTLPLSPTLLPCTWDDYHIYLIATLVFNRLLLDEIYHLIKLLFDWLMMWCWFSFACLLISFYVLLQLFDMRETGRLELASTIILVLQANQLIILPFQLGVLRHTQSSLSCKFLFFVKVI